MKQLVLVAVVLAVGSTSALAAADETPRRAARKPKVIVVDPVDIVSRQRPIVAVEVQRTRPQLGVRDLRRNLVDRIEQAAAKEPF
jgi:hypothetical protein